MRKNSTPELIARDKSELRLQSLAIE